MTNDTIIALASPLGNSPRGIIRLSGPEALNLTRKVFYPRLEKFHSYRVYRGFICNLQSEIYNLPKVPCELYIMKAPRSYTREDVVEIHTLGNLALLNLVIDNFIQKGGVRLAEPGEFTRRAFLSGRIDLAQAEAVLDMIQAANLKELSLAHQHLTGHFSGSLNRIRTNLLDLLARLELSLDFSDQDIEIITVPNGEARGGLLRDPEAIPQWATSFGTRQMRQRIIAILNPVSNLLKQEKSQEVIKDGLLTVLCGRPNVGKSSLFNRLLGKKRAIVHHLPGTTRDIIEGNLKMGHTMFRLFDTAGLSPLKRGGRGCVNKMAHQRTESFLTNADIFLFILDGSRKLEREDKNIFDRLVPDRTIIIINKTDLPQKITPAEVKQSFYTPTLPTCQTPSPLSRMERHEEGCFGIPKRYHRGLLHSGVGEGRVRGHSPPPNLPHQGGGKSNGMREKVWGNIPIFQISALTGKGIASLKKYLTRLPTEVGIDKSSSLATVNTRHRASLARVRDALQRALKTPTDQSEIIALELREALNAIGEITGEVVTDDILNLIFSRFCIGK